MRTHLRFVGAAIVGLTYARSAVYHLENPFAFLRAIESYGVLPTAFSVLAAATLPFVMLSLSIALLFMRELWDVSFKLSITISAIFVAAQVYVISKGGEIDCGCFGPSEYSVIGFRTISLPALLCAVSLGCLIWTKNDAEPQSSETTRCDTG